MADEEDPGAKKLLPSSLQQQVPGLLETQATEILVNAQIFFESQERPPESLTDCTLKISKMDAFLVRIHESIMKLIQINKMEAGMQVCGAKGKRAEQELLPEMTRLGSKNVHQAILHQLERFHGELREKHNQTDQSLRQHTALLVQFMKRYDASKSSSALQKSTAVSQSPGPSSAEPRPPFVPCCGPSARGSDTAIRPV